MRPLYLFLSLLTVSWYACRKPHAIGTARFPHDHKKLAWLHSINKDSFYFYNQAATSGLLDSLSIALAYHNMGVIQSDAGDYYGAQESLLSSLKYLHPVTQEDSTCLSADYNELGSTNLHLQHYDAAIEYYDLAIQFAGPKGYPEYSLNSKALAYQKKKEYSQAIAIYRTALDLSKNDKIEYARILSNLAKTRWLQDPDYPAVSELLKALHIRQVEKDDWGLNASYAHLADYYTRSKPDSALFYTNKRYAIVLQLKSPDDEIEVLQKLIELSPSGVLKQYFVRYQFLNDSIQTARSIAKNQFALIRYETAKHKTENLQLQKDNTEKELQVTQQRIWKYILLILAISVVIIAFLLIRKRRQQAQATIRENQFRTSQKVHDVVANGLYRVIVKIEHQDTIDKESLLDEIEILYEQSRDISYEKLDTTIQEYHETVSHLLKSFATPHTKVVVAGNAKELWSQTTVQTRQQIKHILQELMINMSKHSQASSASIIFEQQASHIRIHYKDNGTGLPANFQYGNGLTNTVSRITAIGGEITFEATTTNGLKVLISFPIA